MTRTLNRLPSLAPVRRRKPRGAYKVKLCKIARINFTRHGNSPYPISISPACTASLSTNRPLASRRGRTGKNS
jgi:hypothetical protein